MLGLALNKQQRIQWTLVIAVVVVSSAALVIYGLQRSISFFYTPSEIIAALPPVNTVFRVGGMVVSQSIATQGNQKVRFALTDGQHTITVVYRGILPDLFAENQGAIARGLYRNGIFYADQILAKHDETYMPPEVAKALQQKHQDPKP